MKKLILIAIAGLLTVSASQAGVLSGTLTTPNGALSGTTNVFLITTNRANVKSVTFVSTATGLASMYDSDITNAPQFGMFYTNAPWVTRGSYLTNQPTSFVGQNGYTNWYTNSYIWVYNITNGANTNELAPLGSFAFVANIPTTIPVDMLFERGIAIRTSTNVTYVINYNSGQ